MHPPLNRDPQLLLVVLPGSNTSDDLYDRAKVLSDNLQGLPSQCVRADAAGIGTTRDAERNRGKRKLYLGNLVLQINAKLGGVNTALDNALVGGGWSRRGIDGPVLRVRAFSPGRAHQAIKRR
jgi:hypothetical protein